MANPRRSDFDIAAACNEIAALVADVRDASAFLASRPSGLEAALAGALKISGLLRALDQMGFDPDRDANAQATLCEVALAEAERLVASLDSAGWSK